MDDPPTRRISSPKLFHNLCIVIRFIHNDVKRDIVFKTRGRDKCTGDYLASKDDVGLILNTISRVQHDLFNDAYCTLGKPSPQDTLPLANFAPMHKRLRFKEKECLINHLDQCPCLSHGFEDSCPAYR